MSSDVTTGGLEGVRPGREAMVGVVAGRPEEEPTSKRARAEHRRRGEQPVVPDATFASYYGQPILNGPVWHSPDVPGYLFLGGLAGASSLLGAGAGLTGRPALARVATVGAAGAGLVSVAALVRDLGRPARFFHMLRVFKVTSPMSVGSWVLSAYVPAALAAAVSTVTGRAPRLGRAAGAAAAALGPVVASYTAALLSDTAVPAWHDAHRELPFVFVGSAATAAGGLGLLGAPATESGPASMLATFGVLGEIGASQAFEHRLGAAARPYRQGRSGRLMRLGTTLSVVGLAGAHAGRRHGTVRRLSGLALLGASAATRFGVFEAGRASAADPRYTVRPQKARVGRSLPAAPPLVDDGVADLRR